MKMNYSTDGMNTLQKDKYYNSDEYKRSEDYILNQIDWLKYRISTYNDLLTYPHNQEEERQNSIKKSITEYEKKLDGLNQIKETMGY